MYCSAEVRNASFSVMKSFFEAAAAASESAAALCKAQFPEQ
jgi:hypothetical protein